MPKCRHHLPQLDGGLFLTDAGIETTLIFLDGFELPYFAAFHLLRDPKGRAALREYFRRHAGIARASDLGFILESATWRASAAGGRSSATRRQSSIRRTAKRSRCCSTCAASSRRRDHRW